MGKNKVKSSTVVSLSALNDIADQWASEKPLRSPSMTPSTHKSNENYFDSNPTLSQNEHSSHHHNRVEAPTSVHQNHHAGSNGHVPQPQLNPPTSKLQQWVSLAKQPKYGQLQQQNYNALMEQQQQRELKSKQAAAQQQKLRE